MQNARSTVRPGIAVALASCSLLLTEITLTRLFSVTMMYHFAFLVLSLTMFGLGLGGMFHFASDFFRRRADAGLVWLPLACALSLPLCSWLVLRIPFSPLELDRANLARLAAIIGLGIGPFLLCGLFLSLVYWTRQEQISGLYAFDLLGAAVGCGSAIWLLERLGATGVPWLAGYLLLACSLLCATRVRGLHLVAVALAGVIFFAGWSGEWLQIRYVKGRVENPHEFEKWNAFSRIAVDDAGERKVLHIDADAATEILGASLAARDGVKLHDGLGGMVYHLRRDGRALVIGPGGGRDLVAAVAANNQAVGVEINPIIARDVMLGRYHDFSGGIYDVPGVRVFVEDGRSFLERSADRFDVIQANGVDTWAASAGGGFTLSESYLYTTEAFESYFRHLTPGGIITMGRWVFDPPQQMIRVVSLALEAMRRLGISQPENKIFAVSDPAFPHGGGTPGVCFIKQEPFTEQELQTLRRVSTASGFRTLYDPGNPPANAYTAMIHAPDRSRFYAEYPLNIGPTADNRPFFFFTLKWRDVFSVWNTSIESRKNNAGLFVLLAVFTLMAGLTAACFLLPLLASRRAPLAASPSLFFFVIGLGFMLLETAVIQRSVLFLGHPTYSFSTVVCALLVGAGLGSGLTSRVKAGDLPGALRLSLGWLVPAVALAALVLPAWLRVALGWSLAARILALAAPLVGLGILLGRLFPLGLRHLRREQVPWAWALNGAASVLGSIVAVLIAMQAGFNAVFWCATGLYALAWAAAGKMGKENEGMGG